ncbi:MAG: hypothetical protein EP343_15380 [Deltaproteobacteria bacterium]|nr:MAG: hypothetical protein EP343_15380 [Deltaproteobacteria bacterium]
MTVFVPGSSRRLTGPNRWTSGPAVIIDVTWQGKLKDGELEAHFQAWSSLVQRAADTLGWSELNLQFHREPNAAMYTFVTPIDVLYVGCTLADVAMEEVLAAGSEGRSPSLSSEAMKGLLEEQRTEQNPALLAMERVALDRDVPFLWDDDEVSLGLGRSTQVWLPRELPAEEELPQLPWDSYHDTPVAFLTGTNGKTTTSRLLARLMRQTGADVGNTSTDGLCINEEIVDSGDWTGPGGARTILRNTNLDVAILETARGGMLRRGLAMERAHVALVTNVSDDHLGEWGIDTVEQMADVKCLIRHSLRPNGLLLLNADCEAIVHSCRRWSEADKPLPFRVGWWTLQADRKSVAETLPVGSILGWLNPKTQQLHFAHSEDEQALPVSEIPLTLLGLAHHNVSNALAAGLAALELGCPWEQAAQGLRTFASTVANNPGRANQFVLNGARVIVDFGHNPDGVEQMAQLAQRLQPQRTLVILGQAGDRTDEAIEGLAEASMLARPDCVLLKQMDKYLRGRIPGEVQALLEQKFLSMGQSPDTIHKANSEQEAVEFAIGWAQPGDLLLLFIQESFATTLQQLQEAGATEGWS